MSYQNAIEQILKFSEPQENCFINSFNLCLEYEDWKNEVLEACEYNMHIFNLLEHFEEHVKGFIVLLKDLEFEYVVEEVYSISKLENSKNIAIPKKAKKFKLLPININRFISYEIAIIFMTEEGENLFSNHITGDY